MIFVPPPFAADSILECIDAGMPLIIAITEGIPIVDMIKVKAALKGSNSRLIGPNCPGTVSYTHLRAHETCRYLVCRLMLVIHIQQLNFIVYTS